MFVRGNRCNVHVDDIFHRLAQIRNHPEHADGTGEGRGVGEYLVAAVGNPVSTRSGIVRVRGDNRFLGTQEIDLILDFVRCGHAAAGGVHAENHRLHGRIVPDLRDERGEAVAGHVGGILAFDNLAIGIDDGNLAIAVVLAGLGLHVVAERNQAHLAEGFFAGQHRQALFQLLTGGKAVHQVEGQEIGRELKFQLADGLVQLLRLDAAPLGDIGRDGFPHGIDQRLVLLQILGRCAVADEHFAGTLVFAMADELNVYAKFIQKILDKNELGAQAVDHAAGTAIRIQINLVGHRRQP